PVKTEAPAAGAAPTAEPAAPAGPGQVEATGQEPTPRGESGPVHEPAPSVTPAEEGTTEDPQVAALRELGERIGALVKKHLTTPGDPQQMKVLMEECSVAC